MNYSNTEDGFHQLQCCMTKLEDKNLKINQVILEKEELKNQLKDATAFIDDLIKKHKILFGQITENYNELWNKYQNSKKDLTKCENINKCLEENMYELNRNYNALNCNLTEAKRTNTCLEEENSKLQTCLNEKKKNTTSFECQVQNLNLCLKDNSEELKKLLQKLSEKKNELENEKCVRRKLQVAHDQLLHKNEKLNVSKLQLNKNIENLKFEIEIQKRHNVELNQTIYEQNTQLKNQMNILERSNEKMEVLKQNMEQECVQSNNYTAKLHREKACVENEKVTLKKEIEERTEDLNRLECQNEQLKSQINELNCKLNTAVENAKEIQKSFAKKIEVVECAKKNLECDVTLKNQTITDLEEKYLEAKRMRNVEIDNVHCLKMKLERLKYNSNNSVDNNNQCFTHTCNEESQLTDQVNDILNEHKLNYENIFKNYYDC